MRKIVFPPKRVIDVKVNWNEISIAEHHWYEAVPGSIKRDEQNGSFCVTLTPCDRSRDEDPFEMIIRHADGRTTVKTEALEDAASEFEVSLLVSADELLAYALDDTSVIYIHISIE